MHQRGFTSHAAMGAAFLAMVWLAVYLPDITPAYRLGGTPMWIALGAGVVGIVICPLFIIVLPGDEGFGFIGLIAALLAGWGSAKLATRWGYAPVDVESARLIGAALGPLLLFLSFLWLIRRAERR